MTNKFKIKSSGRVLLLFTLALIINSCDPDRGLVGNSANEEVLASISPACSSTINFSGNDVFAYKETSGFYSGKFLLGGYTTGLTKEIGFYLPWPPAVGVYNMNGSNAGYYDPVNSPTDPQNSSDQYGTGNTGNVTIERVSFVYGNVDSIIAKLNGIQVKNNTSGQVLCIDNGVLKIKY